MVLQGNIYAETYGPLTISCLYRTQHTCLIGSGVISFRTTVTHIVCLSSLFFYPKRIYGFSASFAIFRRKALQPLTQSIACAIAKLCIRQRKALHLPTQSIASANAKHCISQRKALHNLTYKYQQQSRLNPRSPAEGKAKGRQREGKGQKHINNEGVSNCCDTPSFVFSLKDFYCIGLLTRSSLPCSCERMTCNGFVPFSWPQRRAPQPRQDMPS